MLTTVIPPSTHRRPDLTRSPTVRRVCTNAQIPADFEPPQRLKRPLSRIFGDKPKDVERLVLEGGKPKYYLDPAGNKIEVMACDYGFHKGGQRIYQGQAKYGNVPKSMWDLGVDNLQREAKNIVRMIAGMPASLMAVFHRGQIAEEGFSQVAHQQKELLKQLYLDPAAVDRREATLKEEGRFPQTHPLVYLVYKALCMGLDVVYGTAPIRRFWVLEVVARMPYFAYISVLHGYESLGWWRAGADLRKVHFAEEWNEMHHMEIMESLGGDLNWIDRFLAYHSAMAYYWVLVLLYVISPAHSYDFSTLVETHAYETYSEFIESNEEILKQIPAPLPAVQYYLGDDVYMFESFHTSSQRQPRRPTCVTLYDTFRNIRDDESEHVNTMVACHDEVIGNQLEAKYGDTGNEIEDEQ